MEPRTSRTTNRGLSAIIAGYADRLPRARTGPWAGRADHIVRP